MNKLHSQANRVKEYIDEYGSITRLEAMNELGIANLPAVINIMRSKMCLDIDTERVKVKNRYGEEITYAKYVWGK